MIEFVRCDNCGTKDCNNLYINGFPIIVKDTTMTFEKSNCKCCGSKEYYNADVAVNFCSYKCFWEWSAKNMPKNDISPLERLKQYIAPNKFSTNLSMIFYRMFGKQPPNKEEMLLEDAPNIIAEISEKYDVKNNGIESIKFDKYSFKFEIYFNDIQKAIPVILDIKKQYSHLKISCINLNDSFLI